MLWYDISMSYYCVEFSCVFSWQDLEVCRLIRDEQGEIVTLLNLATTSEALGDRHKSIEWHSLVSIT